MATKGSNNLAKALESFIHQRTSNNMSRRVNLDGDENGSDEGNFRRMNDKRVVGLWSYEGTLTDPFTGNVIANCEGLEIVRHLDTVEQDDDLLRRNNGSDNELLLRKLKTGRFLYSSKNRESWSVARTILSRKLFCYTSTSANSQQGRGELLKNIRIRNGGKKRSVAKDESIGLWDNAITYITATTSAEGDFDNDEKMIVCTEWPDGRFITGTATQLKTNEDDTFEFSIYAKPNPNIRANDDDSSILSLSFNNTRNIQAPRSKLVQFGKDDRSIEQTRYGTRETYHYSFAKASANYGRNIFDAVDGLARKIKKAISFDESFADPVDLENNKESVPTVRYTRYGECPPFYGTFQNHKNTSISIVSLCTNKRICLI